MLHLTKDIAIESVIKKDDITEVTFTAVLEENDKYVGDVNGVITFNNPLTKIQQLGYTFTSSSDFVQKGFTRKDSIPFIATNQSVYRHISYIKQKGKLALNYFTHSDLANVKFENDTAHYSAKSSINLFISKIEKGKNIEKNKSIPLDRPLHENLPKLKKSNANIPLTEEEVKFLEKIHSHFFKK